MIAQNNGADVTAIAAQVQEKGLDPGYRSYGITRPDTGITSLADFKGKKVCFVDEASTSGFLYPTAGLLDAGIDPEKDITPTFAGGHDASAPSVVSGDCDAGFAFDTMVDKERDAQLDQRRITLDWLAGMAADRRISLVGHDPATAAEIDDLAARSGRVAEFPTRIEAARAARERGMPVVAGAPNLLRGGSHTGNVSASELVAAGLVTAVASDYLPSGLVAAAFVVAERGLADLPAAVALVTSGPAEAAGLTDRGRLVPGTRADLALVSPPGGARRWPAVRRVLRAAG